MDELNYVREGCKADIRYEGIRKLCEFLSKIAEINMTVQQNDISNFVALCTCPDTNLEDFYMEHAERYMSEMSVSQIFNHGEIQEIIDKVNSNNATNYSQIEAIHKVNEAVNHCDVPKLRKVLFDPNLGLRVVGQIDSNADDDTFVHIMCLMRDHKGMLN